MPQMSSAETDIPRASQAHCAHPLGVGSLNARPMAIGVLKGRRALALTCGKKRLHLLFWMQGQSAPSRSRTGGPTGTNLTVALGKLDLDERLACILDRCPARTDPTLWTGDPFRFPIDAEMGEVIACLCLIPV